jgi:hypothetical protein
VKAVGDLGTPSNSQPFLWGLVVLGDSPWRLETNKHRRGCQDDLTVPANGLSSRRSLCFSQKPIDN